VKLKVSLQTRFLFSITALLLVLFVVIMFVVQSREVQGVYAEARSRGMLVAEYIASLNLRPLLLWDLDTLQKNADGETDDQLLYVVFYDRSGRPVAATTAIKDLPEIMKPSGLESEVEPSDVLFATRDVRVAGGVFLVLEVERPIFAPGSTTRWASVKIGQSLEGLRVEIRRLRVVLSLIGLGGLLVGVLGSALLARRITDPLRRLVEGTVRISRGDFSRRIVVGGRDEIGDLARSFDEMTGELLRARERMEEANRKLVQAEKLASIGRLSATIAHEIRNPLTSVKLNIQKVAANERADPAEVEHLSIAKEGIAQIEKFVKDLLSFTRVSELQRERFSLEQVLEESLKVLRDAFRDKGIAVETSYAPGLPPALVDGDKLRQVFLNVLRNAWEALDEGGRVDVALDLDTGHGRPRFRVRITDDGPGVPRANRESIFEPFFTTKPSGFGLGLANARKIVEQHNGTIRLARRKGGGSQFVVCLPCEEDSHAIHPDR
jgi:signal transduction histidine kinase